MVGSGAEDDVGFDSVMCMPLVLHGRCDGGERGDEVGLCGAGSYVFTIAEDEEFCMFLSLCKEVGLEGLKRVIGIKKRIYPLFRGGFLPN